jgi:adenylate cyclase
MFKKIALNPWTALLTLAIVLVIRMLDPAFVESVRLRSFDQLITGQPEKPVPVHVVNIDEAALDKLGQFPFPRDMYADIIQDLYKRNAGLVVFNVLMPEADRFRKDGVLAKTLEQIPVILPHVAAARGKNNAFANPVQTVGADPRGLLVEYPGMIANTPVLEEGAAGTGVVNTFPEVDGVVRRMPLLLTTSDGALHAALSLETLRVAGGDARVQAKFSDLGVEAIRVPSQGKIITDRIGRIWIDYSVRPTQHSLAALPADFGGGIVVVGLGAAGLVNPVPTSRGEVWPQELQASVMGTMLNKTTIVRHNLADEIEILAILVAGVLIIFFGIWRRK